MSDAAPASNNASSQSVTAAMAFQFVADLAAEVSAGRVELPAFPDVATRVRKALSDEHVLPDQVARIVGSEAGLAARVLTLANSAALNRSGKTIADLKTAINRIGHNNVRTAAMAFAISQLRHAQELKPIRGHLEKLWNEATMVASLCYAVAGRVRHINADEAMLTGLVHNVGKIYILSRAHKHLELINNPAELGAIMRDWHANVGKAVVENWGFAEHVSTAVGEHEDIARNAAAPDLTDILTVSVLAASYVGEEGVDLELNMQGVRSFTRLGLDNEKFAHILRDCVEEIAALRSALGA